MKKTADVVIIGGGILGASLFYYLTSKGVKNVVLLEQGALASGSTGDSAALVRQHYSNEVSIRLVKKSLEIFNSFPQVLGRADVFTHSGWFFLVPPEAGDKFTQNMAQLKRLGINTREVSIDEAARELPGLNPAGIGRIAFEPDAGYADPVKTVEAFVAKGVSQGGEVQVQTAAQNILLRGGRVEAIATAAGEISTPIVVNAAGPWARRVGQWVGIDLPLQITREPEAIFRPPAGAAHLRHAVSNMVDRTYYRPMSAGQTLIGTGHPKESEPADPATYQREVDQKFISYVSERLGHRLTAYAGSHFVKGWAGLYTVTPDWNMILGQSPDIPGLYLAVGGSGHSFKLGPAMGLCLAELIIEGEAKTVDISPLRATRFTEGDLLGSTYGGNRG